MTSLKLLVVEDDIASLELMTEVFRSLDTEPCPISDSQSAARMVNQEKFDGIFLDLEMPKMHGLELTQAIRQSSWNKLTPIIIVTGCSGQETMKQAFAAGVNFYLQKPIDRQKLHSLFRTVRGTINENRQRSMRVPMQADVSCTIGARTIRGKTWNLSRGGMQVEVEDLKPGESMQASFQLPGSTSVVEVFAKVIWVKVDRQGLQFTRMSNENQNHIRRFIAQTEGG